MARVRVPEMSIGQLRDESVKRAAWHASTSKGDKNTAVTVGGGDDAAPMAVGDGTASGGAVLSAPEAVCDLLPHPAMYNRSDFSFIASFKKSAEGIALSEIKGDRDNVTLFAEAAHALIRGLLRLRSTDGWCILTTPSRRHKDWNFAEAVCGVLAQKTGLPFHRGFAIAKNRDRIKPQFTPLFQIEERNVILYDDIMTTGTSLRAMQDLLPGKNIVTIVGINNN